MGDETFTEIPLSLEFVYATLKEANLLVVKTECLEIPVWEYRTPEKAAFIVARKPWTSRLILQPLQIYDSMSIPD